MNTAHEEKERAWQERIYWIWTDSEGDANAGSNGIHGSDGVDGLADIGAYEINESDRMMAVGRYCAEVSKDDPELGQQSEFKAFCWREGKTTTHTVYVDWSPDFSVMAAESLDIEGSDT